jgi:hypothetical protein
LGAGRCEQRRCQCSATTFRLLGPTSGASRNTLPRTSSFWLFWSRTGPQLIHWERVHRGADCRPHVLAVAPYREQPRCCTAGATHRNALSDGSCSNSSAVSSASIATRSAWRGRSTAATRKHLIDASFCGNAICQQTTVTSRDRRAVIDSNVRPLRLRTTKRASNSSRLQSTSVIGSPLQSRPLLCVASRVARSNRITVPASPPS